MERITISLITPTLGRESLSDTIESVIPQLMPRDEWLIVADGFQQGARTIVSKTYSKYELAGLTIRYWEKHVPGSTYGNAQRNHAIGWARTDYLMFLDDDDHLLPGALNAVRREGVHGVPLMFKMVHAARGCTLWEEPVVREANVGGAMFCVPNIPGRVAQWPETERPNVGDFQFILDTLALWPEGSLRWCEDVIYHCERAPQRLISTRLRLSVVIRGNHRRSRYALRTLPRPSWRKR
ncbi:MAG: glycosyltransferase family A protein [Planctomycetota bacterium]|jgi:glycosyltransferase involved in cell wall biosynthesis